MSAFDLDAQVATPSNGANAAGGYSIVSILTKVACTRTPVCTKATCRCTTTCTSGACTAGCPTSDR